MLYATLAYHVPWEASVREFLDRLQEADVFRDEDVRGVWTQAGQPARYAEGFPGRVNPALAEACARLGIGQLYEHQYEAVQQILMGLDVALTSPTASGKTLSFNLPIVSRLYESRRDHALYVYPLKALENDQLIALQTLTQELPEPEKVKSQIFDGDTAQEVRPFLKAEPPNILITNPDTLHYAMLAYHEQWISFFTSLRYLVLDEAHEYRGYFGINVAYTVRRLLALCESLGAHPQVIVSSATIANAAEHAQALTGRDVEVVAADNAGRPTRHFAFVNPQFPDYQYENLLMHKLSTLAVTCVQAGVSAIVFCPTRRFVERLHRRTLERLRELGASESTIAPYKAGYRPEERRGIEQGLKNGSVLVVFSTNALEVGIDMGRLDMVVMVGFPDTVMSAWQRAGRAGRSLDKEALVLYLASRSAIDQFYVENIEIFVTKPLDHLALNLANEELLGPHALCAVFEQSGSKTYLTPEIVGEPLSKICAKLNPDIRLMKRARPHQRVDLRSILGQMYTIKSLDGQEIGTTSGEKLFSEVYIGAIYDHYGKSWRVKLHGQNEVFVEANTQFHHTKPIRWRVIEPTEKIISGRRWQAGSTEARLMLGHVQVRDTLTGYRELDEGTGDIVDQVTYQAASTSSYRTTACWLEFANHDVGPDELYTQIHSLEHGLRATVPLAVPCDPYDLAGHSIRSGAIGHPTFYLYDAVKGGIGIADSIFGNLRELLEASIVLFRGCKCESSCPRCIQIPRCPEDNEFLDRFKGLVLVETLLDVMSGASDSLNPQTFEWISQAS
jgi:DEAD/DEAH box helicase domain-containing protein